MKVPSALLRQLYTYGSLCNSAAGIQFSLKNRLGDASLTRILGLRIDGSHLPVEDVQVSLGGASPVAATTFTAERPLPFPLRQIAHVITRAAALPQGRHDIQLSLEVRPFGRLDLKVSDSVGEAAEPVADTIPYLRDDGDYCHEHVRARQEFVRRFTGAGLDHVTRHSFDAAEARGNVENFTGVAQVPIGIAGPLRINGEHAQGDFLIPLATTEGTLVASYSRGMKLINRSGGVTCTISDDRMQRAPVFVFDDARGARAFRDWVIAHLAEIRREAEATSRVARLLNIDIFLASRFAYLRFNYSTGDAAGQNMVGRATLAACGWIAEHHDGIRRFFLESNLATDKKASHVNILRTRGKRVTAECTFPRAALLELMRVEPESLHYHNQVANVGALLSGANNNGLHSPNGITAMFIATGQDVANVAEGSAALIYSEVTAAGDLYLSITIPSLIVATHGGGTGLPTQRECLGMLGCRGAGKVNKLAEIVAGVVLAGEISLAAAISSLEWVSAHERYGRHR